MRNQMLVISLAFVLVCAPGCGESDSGKKEVANRAKSWTNLREISQAMYTYYKEHDDVQTPSLAILVKEGLLKADDLISPMSGRKALKTDENGVPTEPGDYVYIPLPFEIRHRPLIRVYEKPENYQESFLGPGTLVLDTAWGVQWMDLKDFQEALERTKKWKAEHNKKSTQAASSVESE